VILDDTASYVVEAQREIDSSEYFVFSAGVFDSFKICPSKRDASLRSSGVRPDFFFCGLIGECPSSILLTYVG